MQPQELRKKMNKMAVLAAVSVLATGAGSYGLQLYFQEITQNSASALGPFISMAVGIIAWTLIENYFFHKFMRGPKQ